MINAFDLGVGRANGREVLGLALHYKNLSRFGKNHLIYIVAIIYSLNHILGG